MKLLFIGLIFFNVHFLPAQELSFPPKVNLFQYVVSESFILNIPNARIWGFSEDGKIAFSEEIMNSASGQIIIFTIFDLVTNNNVFELITGQHIHGYMVHDEALYNLYATSILNALEIHNIIGTETEFLPFPFRINDIVYNGQIIDVEHEQDRSDRGFDYVISKYTVLLTANDKEKIIANFNISGSTTFDVYISGFFLSPFENRAMLVVAEIGWFHGEGRVIGYKFIGFHLEEGFY